MASSIKNGTGRRKSSVARVYLSSGKGKITINGRDFRKYLCRETLANVVLEPLEAIDKVEAYDFNINVMGCVKILQKVLGVKEKISLEFLSDRTFLIKRVNKTISNFKRSPS